MLKYLWYMVYAIAAQVAKTVMHGGCALLET